MSLCALESKKTLMSYTALKLATQSLRSYLKVTCEYELYILPNTKVSTAKDYGEKYMKVRPGKRSEGKCNERSFLYHVICENRMLR